VSKEGVGLKGRVVSKDDVVWNKGVGQKEGVVSKEDVGLKQM
jgi:hypothetical protein